MQHLARLPPAAHAAFSSPLFVNAVVASKDISKASLYIELFIYLRAVQLRSATPRTSVAQHCATLYKPAEQGVSDTTGVALGLGLGVAAVGGTSAQERDCPRTGILQHLPCLPSIAHAAFSSPLLVKAVVASKDISKLSI